MHYSVKIRTDGPGFTDMTRELEKAVKRSGVSEGVCVVTVSDPCAAVVFSQTDNRKAQLDILNEFNILLPPRVDYKSGGTPYASAARTKAALAVGSKDIPVHDGRPGIAEGRSLSVVDFIGSRTIEVTFKSL